MHVICASHRKSTRFHRSKVTLSTAFALLFANLGATAQADTLTLYGVVESGIDYVNNSDGNSAIKMNDGAYTGVYGSRWGMTGSEDLGNGLSAVFRLESGFSVPNGNRGQGGRAFGRQAYVGFDSKTYGSLLLGRQYDSMIDYLQFATTGSMLGSYASHATDIDNLSNSYRVDNVVKYTSPTLGGFRAGGLVALYGDGEDSASNKTLPVWSLGADYKDDSLRIGVAYFHADNPANLFTDGFHYQSNTAGTAIGAAGPWSYVGHPDNVNMFGIAATYTWGDATLAGIYTRSQFANANGTDADVRFDNYDVSVRYQLTPALQLITGYLYTEGRIDYNDQRVKYHRVALGAHYALSKRTEIYGGMFFQHAGGDAKGAVLYQGAGGDMSSTNNQFAARTAIVHRF